MADNEVNIRFGATIDDLKDKLSQVIDSLHRVGGAAASELGNKASEAMGKFGGAGGKMADELKSNLEKVPEAVRGIGASMLMFGTALIGAGLASKKLADENAEMVESTRDFARAMGTTTNEASIMRAALDDVGASQGEFEGAAKGLARQLSTNEAGLNRMGLVTRDVNTGALRPMNDLMVDAIGVLGGYTAGTDRALASKEMFGRGIAASSRLMLINKDVINENTAAVEELGLMVGENATAGFKDYDAAADRAGLTMKAFAKAIQESVLPVATELTEWFNNTAPAAITVLRGALAGLGTAFVSLTNGVRVVWEVINAMVVSVAEPIRALAVSIGQALTGNFLGAAETIKGVPAIISGAWGTAFDKISESSQKTSDRIGRMWAFTSGPDRKAGDSGSPGGTKNYTAQPEKGKEGKDNSGKIDSSHLALKKAENDAELALDLAHLKEAAAIYDGAFKDNLLTIRQFYDAKLAIEQRAIAESMASKRRELSEANAAAGGANKEEDRNKFLAQAAKLQGELNVLTSREAEAVRANTAARQNAEEALADQLAAIKAGAEKAASDDAITTARKEIDQKKALRQIDAEQAFQEERQLQQRSFAATQAALQARAAAIRGTEGEAAKQRAALNAEEQAAERAHQQKLSEIDRAAELERQKYSIQAQRSVQAGFADSIKGLLNGTTTITGALRGFAKTIQDTFANLIAQKFTEKLFDAAGVNQVLNRMVGFVTNAVGRMVERWVTGKAIEQTATVTAEAGKTAAVTAGAATREGVELAASATSKSLTISDAIMSIGAKAWQAAASVYASIAAIPFVGPFLAPAMAVAAGAVVLGFASKIASSEGGEYQVDEDRLNFVHKNETILPAPFAAGLRNMIGEGGVSPLQSTLQQMQDAIKGDAGNAAVQTGGKPSEVGKMVMRWQDGERGDPSVAKYQALQAGEPIGGGRSWGLPANPMPGIVAAALGGGSAAGGGAAAAGRGGADGPTGGGAPRASGDTYHITMNTPDTGGMKRLLMDHAPAVAAAVRAHARDFGTGRSR